MIIKKRFLTINIIYKLHPEKLDLKSNFSGLLYIILFYFKMIYLTKYILK